MSKRFIVVGDKHSHGGVLTKGWANAHIKGHAIVRRGDPAVCPAHGPTVVVSATSGVRFHGADAACEGDVLGCGARLIASQSLVLSSKS